MVIYKYIKSIVKSLINFYKSIALKRKNIFIGTNVSTSRAKFSKYNRISNNTIVNDSSFGKNSYVGENTVLNNVKVGKYTSISSDVKVI